MFGDDFLSTSFESTCSLMIFCERPHSDTKQLLDKLFVDADSGLVLAYSRKNMKKGIQWENVSLGKRDRSQELKSIRHLPTNYEKIEPLKFLWSLCTYLYSLKNNVYLGDGSASEGFAL